jgi:kumamolisin
MPDNTFVTLDGSGRSPITGAEPAGDLDTGALVTLTLVLRRRAELPPEQPFVHLDSHAFAERHGAHPDDVATARRVLDAHGLTVTGVHVGSRRVFVTAPLGTVAEVFGAALTSVRVGESVYRQRTGALRVPAELDGLVMAVAGFDQRPIARPHYRRHARPEAATSLTALQVGAAYTFPANTTGSGQTVAIVELGGGFAQTDLNTFFSGLSITPPTVTAVGVDGAANAPGQDPNGADGEVLLDIEVAGALAPGADFVVYFAPNTDQGFIDAVSDAAHATPTPTAISISWGSPEDQWTGQSRTALDAAIADAATLGVTVTVAAGDNGSGDGETDGKPHVDFPASSANALACGGTTLELNSDGSIASEVVWNETASGSGATGGGVSTVFARPSWQATVTVPNSPSGSTGRGVPDVAGNADPTTGYQVVIDGKSEVIGGTSAVAPLWAALVARLAQGVGRKLGLVQTTLYAGATATATAAGFHDVTSGDNGAYSAAAGWDACTGLGTPDGTALLKTLGG